MNIMYLYLAILIVIFVFIGFKVALARRHAKQADEEREDNVFYDAVKNIRRD